MSELMNRYYDLCIIEENKKEKEIRQILSNDDYINWILRELNKGKRITSSFLINGLENDKHNQLELFFGIVQTYADSNYLEPVKDEYGEYYVVIYKNTTFIIGKRIGQEDIYYAKKADNRLALINFENILQRINLNCTESKRKSLETIKNEIARLRLLDMSDEKIRTEISKMFIKSKK